MDFLFNPLALIPARLGVFLRRWCIAPTALVLAACSLADPDPKSLADKLVWSALLFLAGCVVPVKSWLRHRRAGYLRVHGLIYWTEGAEVVMSKDDDGDPARPYTIVTRWRHPRTGETNTFLSPPFWADPAPYLAAGISITVYVDRHRPHRYHMDLPFLPWHLWVA